jgi:hypothetical protein
MKGMDRAKGPPIGISDGEQEKEKTANRKNKRKVIRRLSHEGEFGIT